ncbi:MULTISPECIES: hypothetical protein [unclassified Paenibacillus]|uniref:hypothetical protein n=1 Tax=unclassified Paenibacillus TaxID=185978 RepID=UPI0010500FAB|nr:MULTISPECIES: hypothetical protein [unclassified Paenibacillus]NIK71870.1 putative transcriptional regulator [Paenibacillus sp. BK720]TCM96520.1 hypothetical protein EV294_105387 [Paenibacillus sp. BK033]
MNDTERKLLRILYNRNGHQNTRISIPELARFAQREVGQIRKALENLREERFIEWEDSMDYARVIPGWLQSR